MERDAEIRAAVGAVIRDARRARGLKLKELAALADLDWSQLSKVERGRVGVSQATLERIGRELGFTLPAIYAAAVSLDSVRRGSRRPSQRLPQSKV